MLLWVKKPGYPKTPIGKRTIVPITCRPVFVLSHGHSGLQEASLLERELQKESHWGCVEAGEESNGFGDPPQREEIGNPQMPQNISSFFFLKEKNSH